MSRKSYNRRNPRRVESLKAKRQQKSRRKDRLFTKAYKYSIYCDANVYVLIRTRKDGRIFSFTSDSINGWPPSLQELVYSQHR